MSFTRFYDDDIRIKKQLQEMCGPGYYQLNTPGPNIQTPFIEDPQIRLQYWGANLQNNTVNLENNLWGIDRKLDRDLTKHTPLPLNEVNFPSCDKVIVNETRTLLPAWNLRDLENKIKTDILLNTIPPSPQILPFVNNMNSRER